MSNCDYFYLELIPTCLSGFFDEDRMNTPTILKDFRNGK